MWAFFPLFFFSFGQRGKRRGICVCVSGRFFSFVPLRAAASRRERGTGSTLSVSYCLLLTCSVGSEEEADEEAETARSERRRATETKRGSERRARALAAANSREEEEGRRRSVFVAAPSRGMVTLLFFIAGSGASERG